MWNGDRSVNPARTDPLDFFSFLIHLAFSLVGLFDHVQAGISHLVMSGIGLGVVMTLSPADAKVGV